MNCPICAKETAPSFSFCLHCGFNLKRKTEISVVRLADLINKISKKEHIMLLYENKLAELLLRECEVYEK